MLFNSHVFISVFLPVTLALFFILGSISRRWALQWIIFASLCFYAWWRPINIFIIIPAILTNYVIARTLLQLGNQEKIALSRTILVIGIIFNLGFLGYFKYANFAVNTVNDIFGRNFVLEDIILPLGISFITFQVIGFLIDVQGRRVKSFTFHDFSLFVLFFPQLIAGPIVHYREMMPQFHRIPCIFDKENVSVGLTLFALGLFKKVFLADNIALYVTPIYEMSASGQSISLLTSWMAALGFTLQIYFDFSGYSDMALGIARLFGIRLPKNFDSPLRTSSIIDFWLRWHVTLTRFLTAYVYNPLALSRTRKRLAMGKPGFGGKKTTTGAFLELLMFPTVFTMFLSGLWHGAGYLFIIWGLLHGFYLAINHAWRLLVAERLHDKAAYNRFMRPTGFVITLLCVAASMVVFRATSVESAANLLKGMIGLNGIALPNIIYDRLGSLAEWFSQAGVVQGMEVDINFNMLAAWIGVLSIIAFIFPNTLDYLSKYEPALGVKPHAGSEGRLYRLIAWKPSLLHAALLSVIAAVGILYISGESEFLYWNF